MRATIAAIGRTLVTVGLLILLFVGYQLWGTGFFQARAQNRLERQFADLLGAVPTTTRADPPATTTTSRTTPTTSTTSSAAPTTTTAPLTIPVISSGDPIATIRIPRIDVDTVVVQGTAREDLKKGPGHYPATPLPGQYGNAAIAGHRTTYGAPFNRLDELKRGDLILTRSLVGQSVYVVSEVLVVSPDDVSVVANTPDRPLLTLTTCNPEYSARQRLVVRARMVEESSDPPRRPSKAGGAALGGGTGHDSLSSRRSLESGLAGDSASRAPALLWGMLAALVGALWWWAFRRWRHPATWVGGAVPFLAFLFVFYVYLERVLPAGY